MNTFNKEKKLDSRIELAADVYVWGMPLVIMHRTRALHCSRGGPGELRHRLELSTARSRTVVAPNNDTLYSTGWYDLRAGDLILQVPPMDDPGRYWSVMLLDAFTHVTYVSRRQYGVGGANVRLTYDPRKEHDHSQRAETIALGTPTVWILVRTLVDGPEDLARARTVQQGIRVTTPQNHPSAPTPLPPGPPNEVYSAGASFLDELRQALSIDPPAEWHPKLTKEQQNLFDGNVDKGILAAGVSRGHERIRDFGFGADRFQNGWGTRSKGTEFGQDVLARAACAQFTLAGHHRQENSSYTVRKNFEGEPLDGRRALALRFPPGEEPPAKAFWSLTVYGPDMFFYDNPFNRYSIGDRTPGLVRNTDGLTIIIGGDPPAGLSNWLPAPAGPYLLGLRIYEGREDVVAATWFPPPLVQTGE